MNFWKAGLCFWQGEMAEWICSLSGTPLNHFTLATIRAEDHFNINASSGSM
jgi:hypothetical protein